MGEELKTLEEIDKKIQERYDYVVLIRSKSHYMTEAEKFIVNMNRPADQGYFMEDDTVYAYDGMMDGSRRICKGFTRKEIIDAIIEKNKSDLAEGLVESFF